MSILGQDLTEARLVLYWNLYNPDKIITSLASRPFLQNPLTPPFLSAIALEQAMCEAVLLKVNMIKTIRMFFGSVRIKGRVQPETAVPKISEC
jgi:hypothetical protein